MLYKSLPICYDASHEPFSDRGPPTAEKVESSKPISKVIRAVLRRLEIDASEAVNHSIHRCSCNSTMDHHNQDALDSESTLDQLEIRDGDALFIRRRVEQPEDGTQQQEQAPTPPRRSSRKRERAREEPTSRAATVAPITSTFSTNKRVKKVFKLDNLEPTAALAANSISRLLGGHEWKTQSIGNLGPIQTRGHEPLTQLLKAVKISLALPSTSKKEKGKFSPDLIEALIRSFDQRQRNPKLEGGGTHYFRLNINDFMRARVLLEGKLADDGSWEVSRQEGETLDVRTPRDRFPLAESGLSGKSLSSARSICLLWDNAKWLSQEPFPNLSPITLKNRKVISKLRRMVELTRIKVGDETPDGFPKIVLEAIQKAIEKRRETDPWEGKYSTGWSQSKDLPVALKILEKELGIEDEDDEDEYEEDEEEEEKAVSTSAAAASSSSRRSTQRGLKVKG